MNKQYWDSLAKDYKNQVFSVYTNDKKGILTKTFDQYINRKSNVADFGCGIGGGIPLLAKRARTVYAIDISPKLLACAQNQCKEFDNVNYIQCDLLKKLPSIKAVQCIVSVNVLISPKADVRKKILNSINKSLGKKGIFILVVPSLESQMWIYNRQFAMKSRKSQNISNCRSTINKEISQEIVSLSEGILKMPDTKTKYYLNHEIDYFLSANGFDILSKTEIPYTWKEELLNINNPKISRPWNWLVVAQKT